MKTIIFDIDNTLAGQSDREKKAMVHGKLDWKIFQDPKLLIEDKPIKQTIYLLQLLVSRSDWIIIVTARKEKLREVTQKWLLKNHIYYNELYMRPDDDNRPDVEFKEDLYENCLKNLDIFCVFEDRMRCCKMWQSKGLYVFECNNLKGNW